MVDSVEIKRVGIRDYLSIDVEAWMNDPDDMDFKPRTHLNGNRFSISSATNGRELASVELDDDEQMEAAERAPSRTKSEIWCSWNAWKT